MTTNILIIAPLERSVHIAPIISILEYMATPKVAEKKHRADTNIDGTTFSRVFLIAICLSLFFVLSSKYLVDISIA